MLISNLAPNYPMVCIIVLMYRIFLLMVLYIIAQMLLNVFGMVFLEKKSLKKMSVHNN